MKKIIFSLCFSVFALVGCGGGGDSSEPLTVFEEGSGTYQCVDVNATPIGNINYQFTGTSVSNGSFSVPLVDVDAAAYYYGALMTDQTLYAVAFYPSGTLLAGRVYYVIETYTFPNTSTANLATAKYCY
jgi:hypothetical protein